MKKKILIIASIIVLLAICLSVIFAVNVNKKNSTMEKKKEKDVKITTTSKNDEYVEEIQDQDVNVLVDVTERSKGGEENSVPPSKTTSKKVVVNTTKVATTQSKQQTTTTTTKVTTTTRQCIEQKFSSPFFRGDFKNDEGRCHSTGRELVARTGNKHRYECEYEYDDCNIKWWMLNMRDETGKKYNYRYFDSLYPQY